MYCTFWFCSNFPLETSDCILHRSYVCKLTKKKWTLHFRIERVYTFFLFKYIIYLLFSHELRWEMRLRNTPRCKSDDKRYSLDFEHQETIYRFLCLCSSKCWPAEPLNAPLGLWEVAAVLVELLYEVLSAIFCFHFVQNDEVSDLRERSVLW